MAAVVCGRSASDDVEAMGALVAAVAEVGAAITGGIQRGIEEQPRLDPADRSTAAAGPPVGYSAMIL